MMHNGKINLEYSNENIISLCLQGNRKAQEQLFRTNYSFAMSIAMRYAKDNAEAADIVSIAFVNVFKGLATFNIAKGNFTGWLKRIVINEAIDFIKQFHKFESSDIEFAENEMVYNETIKNIDAQYIMQLIQQLPRATHAVFMLYIIDGYKHKEIAQILNISEGTSKWHLNEARNILQKKLQHLK